MIWAPTFQVTPEPLSIVAEIDELKEGWRTLCTLAPDWTPGLTFFLEVLQCQMRRLRGKVERERLLLATLPDLASQMLLHTRDHGRVTIADAVAIAGRTLPCPERAGAPVDQAPRRLDRGQRNLAMAGRGQDALRTPDHISLIMSTPSESGQEAHCSAAPYHYEHRGL